tara:strand:+ start:3594 stop:3974 length:381 start_codon:yes stop_codon:yes gene_type:complete
MKPRLLALAILTLAFPCSAKADKIVIAEGGTAKLTIVVSPKASEAVRATASDLARYLERISGATFEITEASGENGLVLGLPDQFPNLPFPSEFGKGTFERDHYRMTSTRDGLYLLGATPDAVAFAA